MSHHFVSGEGALWAQRNGPNTVPVYLGCHQLGDVDQPEGDLELIYCPDASGPSRFETVGSLQGAAGAITTSVTTDVTDELDELERAKCPFTLFAHMSKSGRKDVFTNYDRTFVFTNVRITSKGLSNLVARTPDDNARSEQTFDLSAEALFRLFTPTLTQVSVTEYSAINDITFCNDESCRTDEDPFSDACELGFAVTDAGDASPTSAATVIYKTATAAWTYTAADPFAIDEDISGVECFPLGRDTIRVIVSRGEADGANPAEIAYSDDYGTTWTNVNVDAGAGTTFVPERFSLFALDRNNIYAGLNNGYIYKSSDAGLSWTAVESAGIHSGAWNAIHFVDSNVGWVGGAANVLAKTVDGASSWSTITGPTAMAANDVVSLFVLDRNRVWVGYSSGNLYYTLDGGTTWSERAFTGSGTGSVRDIQFLNDNIGYLATNNASPVGTIHWTIDGGYSWDALTTPTNAGLNRVYICNEWNIYGAGEVYGGTGFIVKGTV